MLLFASSKKKQLKCMLEDLVKRTKDVGLEIHLGKTKILNNMLDDGRDSSEGIDIGRETIKILALDESTMYLGRKLTLGSYHDTEIDHRIACGWAKFNQYKKELCCRHYPLIDRLRLFESVITPTVLYSARTWTTNAARTNRLKVAQRRMLRSIVQVVRKRGRDLDGTMLETSSEQTELEDAQSESSNSSECPLSQKGVSSSSSSSSSDSEEYEETWVQWIARATKTVEKEARKANITNWIEGQKRRKWGLAGHTVRRDDGRWSTTALDWVPAGKRKVGHPVTRWCDTLMSFATEEDFDWKAQALKREDWAGWMGR